jgi:hypothetical protein
VLAGTRASQMSAVAVDQKYFSDEDLAEALLD